MMTKTFKVLSVNISPKKGIAKHPVSAVQLTNQGVEGDAHAGLWHRQVSLLAQESIDKFELALNRHIARGEFAENITTKGVLIHELQPLDRLINKHIELEITQIGKKCNGTQCRVFREIGDCVMPKEGVFARVVKGGTLKAGMQFKVEPKVIHVAVISLNNQNNIGEYDDKSGKMAELQLQKYFADINRPVYTTRVVVASDTVELRTAFHAALYGGADIIVTTGGTGFGPRDVAPEVVHKLIDKEIPGVMDYIRTKIGADNRTALLNCSVAGVIDQTLVYTLPGNMNLAGEYLAEIVPMLNDAILMLHGIDE